ncbi:hypothetical protein HMPREF3213_01472 [Heyndrickxia coagulans]|uniref:Uncharacterized protein n=1 Tax=Heyndrickxia coagulans TaxID=1398 RepID=A0A133KTZ7_HEYCO|nr:hypothetical protein HMPREF3213_01472 [Heyndrickxia coagulans]
MLTFNKDEKKNRIHWCGSFCMQWQGKCCTIGKAQILWYDTIVIFAAQTYPISIPKHFTVFPDTGREQTSSRNKGCTKRRTQ